MTIDEKLRKLERAATAFARTVGGAYAAATQSHRKALLDYRRLCSEVLQEDGKK